MSKKKDDLSVAFPAFRRLALTVLLVVLVATYLPVVRLEGLFAVGKILLGEERLLVRRHQRQVLAAGFDRRCYSSETCASAKLVCTRIGRTLVRVLLADIHTVAIRARGGRSAVGTQKVVTAGVTVLLFGFREGTGNAIDTGCPNYFCHKTVCFSWC